MALEFERSNSEERRNLWAEETEAFRAQQEREHEIRAAMADSAKALGLASAQAATAGLANLAKGHKVSMGAIVESLGDQLVARGTMDGFEGASRLLSSYGIDPTGWSLVALGATEVTAGIAMGAAGARNGGSASGGGGGRGRGGRGGGASVGGASGPLRSRDGGGSGGGDTIVHVTMPTVVSPSAEDGRRVNQAIRESRRVYGEHA